MSLSCSVVALKLSNIKSYGYVAIDVVTRFTLNENYATDESGFDH